MFRENRIKTRVYEIKCVAREDSYEACRAFWFSFARVKNCLKKLDHAPSGMNIPNENFVFEFRV